MHKIKYDKRKKWFLTIDVESIGTTSPIVYDWGYAIHDKKGNILLTRSFLVKETWENEDLMKTAYYSSKIGLYHAKLERKEIVVASWIDILNCFHNDLRKYVCHYVCAYNLQFDMGALTFTHSYYGYKGKILPYKMDLLCIWGLACETIMLADRYYNFCKQYKFESDKGNIKTNAEICYRYLTGELDFIEEHTGLADTLIEIYILSKCINHKHSGGIITNCWQLPQRKKGG